MKNGPKYIEATHVKRDAAEQRIIDEDTTQCPRLCPVGENDAVLGIAAPL